jgi:hypothetical protein
MSDIEKLKAKFDAEMLDILESEREVGFSSNYFRRMVNEFGGVETAHRLLRPERQLPPMFAHLRRIGRTDLTVENRILKEQYRPLFSEDERAVARFRLDHEKRFC